MGVFDHEEVISRAESQDVLARIPAGLCGEFTVTRTVFAHSCESLIELAAFHLSFGLKLTVGMFVSIITVYIHVRHQPIWRLLIFQ